MSADRVARYVSLLRRYRAAAAGAIERGDSDVARWLTIRCPECGEIPRDGIGHTTRGGYVTIGCEGYFVIDPRVLGIESPYWSDWKGETE